MSRAAMLLAHRPCMNVIFEERHQKMRRLTHPFTRTLAAAAFIGVVGLSGAAHAASDTDATAPTAVRAATTNQAKTAPMDQVEKRISDLHAKLHITAAQETQWTAVAGAMRDNAQSMDTLIKERSAKAKTMTAVEDLDSYEKLAAAHEDGLKKLIPVFQALYDSMSDEQRKGADAAFRSRGPHETHKKT